MAKHKNCPIITTMWEKLEFSMQRHKLIHKKPTYLNIAHVEKIESATRNGRQIKR